MKFLSSNNQNYTVCQKKGGAHKNIPAVKYCCDCKHYFCKECHVVHDSILEDHKVVDANSVNPSLICPTHFKSFTFYCSYCKKYLCDDCNKDEHKNANHKTSDLKDSSEKTIKNINDFENFILKDLYDKKEKVIGHLKDMIKNIEDDYTKFLNEKKISFRF